MKLLRRDSDNFQLEFAPEEKALLFHLLNLYPLVPASYHRLTKNKKLTRREENQHLLDEALAAQREQNKKEILALVNKPARFTETDGATRAAFIRSELEWMLQVVNDVRVGSWIALGSPGYGTEKKTRRDKQSVRHLMFMELAGAFEMFFLGIINGTVPPAVEK
jgi:hypothetical protein